MTFFRNATAAALFDNIKEPYHVFQRVAKPREPPPRWAFEVVNEESHRNLSAARWIAGTSFLHIPHRNVDNLFHFHNNFFLPLMLNVMLSGSENEQRRLFLFKTWPLANHGVLKGKKWPHESIHPVLFYAMEKVFSEVVWPVDDIWAAGQQLCFRRFVWSQRLTPMRYPYYDYASTDRLYRNMGVTTRVRNLVRTAMRVAPPPPMRSTAAPSVLWISRQPTCHPKVANAATATSAGRCVRNLVEVLDGLRRTSLFGPVRVMDDFKLRHDAHERTTMLRDQLEMLRDTDILMGMHGAGLSHIAYLGQRATIVELKGHFWSEEGGKLKIYLAMARLQQCAYMSVDVRSTMPMRSNTGYTLSPAHVERIAGAAKREWVQAQNYSKPPTKGCTEHRSRVTCHCTHLTLLKSDRVTT